MSHVFRVRFDVRGGHVHCRVFSAPRPDHTFAKLGDLVVTRGPEFVALMQAFDGAEFLGEREGVGIVLASERMDR